MPPVPGASTRAFRAIASPLRVMSIHATATTAARSLRRTTNDVRYTDSHGCVARNSRTCPRAPSAHDEELRCERSSARSPRPISKRCVRLARSFPRAARTCTDRPGPSATAPQRRSCPRPGSFDGPVSAYLDRKQVAGEARMKETWFTAIQVLHPMCRPVSVGFILARTKRLRLTSSSAHGRHSTWTPEKGCRPMPETATWP